MFTVPVKNSVGDVLIDVVGHSNAFLIVAVPPSLHSTTQPQPSHSGHSCTSPSRPEASNTRLEPALSRFSLLAHIKLLHPHPHNHPPCNSLPLSRSNISLSTMSRKTTTRIQYAALRLFDRLACDALQPAMKKVTSRSQT